LLDRRLDVGVSRALKTTAIRGGCHCIAGILSQLDRGDGINIQGVVSLDLKFACELADKLPRFCRYHLHLSRSRAVAADTGRA
jgi:hypothetical protein